MVGFFSLRAGVAFGHLFDMNHCNGHCGGLEGGRCEFANSLHRSPHNKLRDDRTGPGALDIITQTALLLGASS
jgi:hypothetical protein